jgi:eukaryotic-like serine/threonine-protein kinase
MARAANWRTLNSYARLGRKYGNRAEKHRKVRKVPAPPADSIPTHSTTVRQGYEFDEFAVETGQRTLYRRGEPIQLPSRAFDTLIYLIENRHRCVRKDEIIGTIWHDVVVTDDSLIHAISVLRRVLGDERHQPKFIRTVPRRGYRFVAAVKPTQSAEAPALQGAPPSSEPEESPADSTVSSTPQAAITRSPLARRRWLIAGGSVTAVAAALLWFSESRTPPDASLSAGIQLFQPAPAGTSLVSGGVLSPDGRYLAFVASDDATGRTGLWIRSLHTDSLRRLAGSEGASKQFWSPDGRQIAYFANGKLNATDLASDTTRTITTVFAAGGGSWGSDGTILFAEWASGLYAVPASGDGNVKVIATLDREEDDIAFAWPQLFPDNRRFLYQIRSLDPERTGLYVGDLKTQQNFKLLDTTSFAALAPPHHLLHVKNDMLIADELDMERLELTGRAVVVARGISEPSLAADDIVSASSGLLAFRSGVTRQSLVWVDRDGEQVGSLAMPTPLFNPRLSPDGSALLGSGSVTADPGLWLVRLRHEEYSRIEQDAVGPIWSPDGQHVALAARGGLDLIVRSMYEPQERRVLTSDDGVKILNDWTPDGSRLIYTRHDPSTGLDLWVIDVATGATRPLLATPHSETQARISPDGQSIAYVSDESGMIETYVARFPGLENRKRVSVGGGGQPQWRSDQRELFYLSLERALMSVEVSNGHPHAFGPPRQLFRASVPGDPRDARDFFAANANGTRFLLDHSLRGDDGQAITVIVNWSARTSRDAPDTAMLSRRFQ